MVYFTDGVKYGGHRPTRGDDYKRQATKFTLGDMPGGRGGGGGDGRFKVRTIRSDRIGGVSVGVPHSVR